MITIAGNLYKYQGFTQDTTFARDVMSGCEQPFGCGLEIKCTFDAHGIYKFYSRKL